MTGSKHMTTEEMALKYVLQEERKRETTRIWRLAHKDEVDAKVKVYHQLNKERVKENNRLWRLANKDEISKKVKSYYQLNKERLNKRCVELAKLKKTLQTEYIESEPHKIE
jgi:hypothetical protein